MVELKQAVVGLTKQSRLTLLSLVCASVGLLAGCGDSPTAAANKAAVAKSDQAGRLTASAGDTRAADSLINQVHATPVSELPALHSSVTAQIKAVKGDAFQNYIQTRPAFDDLKLAATLLNDALPTGAEGQPSDALVGILRAQLGNVANQQAQVKLVELHDLVIDLINRAVEIQSLVNRINALSALATVPENHQSLPSLTQALEAAQANLTAVTAKKQEKDAAFAALQEQVNQKKLVTKQTYDQAKADQLAADDAKGDASVEAYRKAMELKGQADKSAGEIAVLLPKLAAADSEAQVAAIELKEAQEHVDLLKTSTERQAKRATSAAAEAKQYRAMANSLITEPKEGLADQLKQFKEAARKADSLVTIITAKTKEATEQFKQASSKTEFSDVKPLLTWFQASAKYRTGEADLGAWMIADLHDTVANSVNTAYHAAQYNSDPVADAGTSAQKAREAAQKDFEAAATMLEAPAMKNASEKTPVRWLAQSLRALVNNRLYILTSDEKFQKVSQEAAKDALGLNPQLNIRNLLPE